LVSWFLFISGVKWEWVLWRSDERVFVSETPSFEGETIWRAQANVEEFVVDFSLLGQVGGWPWAGELAWDAAELTASDINLCEMDFHSNFSVSLYV